MNNSFFQKLTLSLVFGGASCVAAEPVKPIFSTADGKPDAEFYFLEPGFTVRELPLRLTALNNLVYDENGRLYAAGYDGRIWTLRDTDGDGLEDEAKLFWEGKNDYQMPMGLVVRGDSVYVTLRRRIERLRDTDGDGVADVSEIAGTGWHQVETETDQTFQQRRVDDAIGLAMDGEGRLYTSLGTPNHANGWQTDEQGESHYRRERFRGSVIRIGKDGKPEQIASGVRFAVAMHFNRHGDLFATDQEGYTWGPGNPYDELLQIVPTRHYGFPPKHPKWLPDVIDEPSIVDFGPMHQSVCGFFFNESRTGWKRFGPVDWEDNVLVTGESRGKLWRVPLAKTREGYVGHPVLIGGVNLLPIDVCQSPEGAMLVTCHSGKPDWGNGPIGEGRIYKITYSDPTAPRIVSAWAASANEVRVALSAPLPKDAVIAAEIVGGRYVRAGDARESFRPGYAVIGDEQRASPTHRVAVASSALSADRREIILTTAPHPWQCNYALKVNWKGGEATADYGFGGVRCTWTAAGADEPNWRGWLPHPNLDVAKQWMQGSITHEALFNQLAEPGTLQMEGALAPRDLAQSQEIGAIERVKKKGSGSLAPSRGEYRVELVASGAGSWKIGAEVANFRAGERSQLVRAEGETLVPFRIRVATGPQCTLTLTANTSEDPISRPLSTALVLVPDAPLVAASGAPIKQDPSAQFVRGNAASGEQLFTTTCAICHTFRGKGTLVGPDLTNSPERDPGALLVDILDPNASLNPDHIAYELTRRDGQVVIGVIASDRPGRYLVHLPGGVNVSVEYSDIVSQRQLTKSLMPEGFKALGEEKLRDLVTYLITPAQK